MGSEITLSVGNLVVDWGKDEFFNDHSELYMPGGRNSATYYYANNVRKNKPALVRPLARIKDRLELLGYPISECRRQFKSLMTEHENRPFKLPYPEVEEIDKIIHRFDFERQDLPDFPEQYDLGKYVARASSQTLNSPNLLFLKNLAGFAESLLGELHPYVILRLLAENPDNLGKPVIWRFADVVEDGSVTEDEFVPHLEDSDRYLVVTEGSSDSKVLQRSLQRLLPDVSDFFYFVDMSENYPFTGTGNLLRFCQGLARIRIQNRVLVVLDNDTAGNEVWGKLRSAALPATMLVKVLPRLPEFDHFPTIGPSGNSWENINGKALSIEMFLDLAYKTPANPKVRWTSFNQELGQYHGELMDKERYVRLYLDGGWRVPEYDHTKLQKLWNFLFDSCIEQWHSGPIRP